MALLIAVAIVAFCLGMIAMCLLMEWVTYYGAEDERPGFIEDKL